MTTVLIIFLGKDASVSCVLQEIVGHFVMFFLMMVIVVFFCRGNVRKFLISARVAYCVQGCALLIYFTELDFDKCDDIQFCI